MRVGVNIYFHPSPFTITEQRRSINKSIPCNSHSPRVLNLIPLRGRPTRASDGALRSSLSVALNVTALGRRFRESSSWHFFFSRAHNNLIGKYLWKGWPDARQSDESIISYLPQCRPPESHSMGGCSNKADSKLEFMVRVRNDATRNFTAFDFSTRLATRY